MFAHVCKSVTTMPVCPWWHSCPSVSVDGVGGQDGEREKGGGGGGSGWREGKREGERESSF